MFPLVHNFAAASLLPLTETDPQQRELLTHTRALGALLPDLMSGMGRDRDFGHTMGEAYFNYCLQHNPALVGCALAAISHGIPAGIDQYADEEWQGAPVGWCFLVGEDYSHEIAAACNLPEKFRLWKSHNFVEMGMELIINREYPQVAASILAASADEQACELVAAGLADFAQIDAAVAKGVLQRVPQIFSLENPTASSLAERYAHQLGFRHQILNCDAPRMAQIIEQIYHEQQQSFDLWLAAVLPQVRQDLEPFLKQI